MSERRLSSSSRRRQRRGLLWRSRAAKEILALLAPPPISHDVLLSCRCVWKLAPAVTTLFNGLGPAGVDSPCSTAALQSAVVRRTLTTILASCSAPGVGEAGEAIGAVADVCAEVGSLPFTAPSRSEAMEMGSFAGRRDMSCTEFWRVAQDVKSRLPYIVEVRATPLLAITYAPSGFPIGN